MVESIDIKILDRLYTIACSKDEEQRVRNVSFLLEKKAKIIKEKYGSIPERNMLFMISLMIADEAVKVHSKNANYENDIAELKKQINLFEQKQNQQMQDSDLKLSETIYILEKILNRIQQINSSIKEETQQLSIKINNQEEGI